MNAHIVVQEEDDLCAAGERVADAEVRAARVAAVLLAPHAADAGRHGERVARAVVDNQDVDLGLPGEAREAGERRGRVAPVDDDRADAAHATSR